MTKQCDSRLKSLIIPFKDQKFYQALIPLSYDVSLPNILSNIMNFEGLEKLAIILLEYFNINENLEELKEKLHVIKL